MVTVVADEGAVGVADGVSRLQLEARSSKAIVRGKGKRRDRAMLTS